MYLDEAPRFDLVGNDLDLILVMNYEMSEDFFKSLKDYSIKVKNKINELENSHDLSDQEKRDLIDYRSMYSSSLVSFSKQIEGNVKEKFEYLEESQTPCYNLSSLSHFDWSQLNNWDTKIFLNFSMAELLSKSIRYYTSTNLSEKRIPPHLASLSRQLDAKWKANKFKTKEFSEGKAVFDERFSVEPQHRI